MENITYKYRTKISSLFSSIGVFLFFGALPLFLVFFTGAIGNLVFRIIFIVFGLIFAIASLHSFLVELKYIGGTKIVLDLNGFRFKNTYYEYDNMLNAEESHHSDGTQSFSIYLEKRQKMSRAVIFEKSSFVSQDEYVDFMNNVGKNI